MKEHPEIPHPPGLRKDKWLDSYEQLLATVEACGGVLNIEELPPALGRWVSNQRLKYNDPRKRNPASAAALEQIPGWTWLSLREERWERRLHEFVRARGDYRAESTLGHWVKKQRTLHRNGKLLEDRRRRLESSGLWSWEPDDYSARCFEALSLFIEFHGHARVPQGYVTTDGLALGTWVNLTRQRGKSGNLPPEMEQRLRQMPEWQWEGRGGNQQQSANEVYLRIGLSTAFGEATRRIAHFSVDMAWTELMLVVEYDGSYWHRNKHEQDSKKTEALKSMGWTVVRVRETPLSRITDADLCVDHPRAPRELATALRDHLLSLGIAQAANAVFPRNIPDEAYVHAQNDAEWQRRCGEVADILSKGGTVTTKYRSPDGFKLGTWVSTQRSLYHRAALLGGRVQALESIPGWSWDPYSMFRKRYENGWATWLSVVTVHLAMHGQIMVSDTTPEGDKVGSWAAIQRKLYRDGTLRPERVTELEAIPGWRWDADLRRDDDGWEQRRQIAARLLTISPHLPASATAEGIKIGAWAAQQRSAFRQNKLRVDRVSALEATPGWYWEVDAPIAS